MENSYITPPHTPTKSLQQMHQKRKKKKLKLKCPCIINNETCNQPLSLAIGYCKCGVILILRFL